MAALVAAVAAGCGSDDEAAQEPHEIADEMFVASHDGDNETWKRLHALDAVTIFPDGTTFETFGDAPFVIDDFDGDGVTSFADDMQARNMLHEAAGQTMTWKCSTVAQNQAECSVTATDGFIEAGGGAPLLTSTRLTIEDGKIVEEEFLEAADPSQMAASQEIWFRTLTDYERWVRDTYPDQYPMMFHGPCCEGSMIMLPDSIVQHTELLPDYLAGSS